VADPSGTIRLEVEGECPGLILGESRGCGGFGYDPVFLVPRPASPTPRWTKR